MTNPARRHGPRYRSQRIFRRLWRRQCRLERDQRGLIAGRDPRRSSSLARYPTAGPGASTSAPTTRNGSRTTASTTMTSSRSSDQLSFFLNSTYRREMQKQQERLFPSLCHSIYIQLENVQVLMRVVRYSLRVVLTVQYRVVHFICNAWR